FLAVTNSLPRLAFQVLYTPNSLSSTLIQLILSNSVPFGSIVTTGNAGAVAAAFDTLNSSDPDVAFLDQFLGLATASQLQCDFDQMQPALFNGIPIVMESAITSVRKTLSDRMQEIHGVKCYKKRQEDVGFYPPMQESVIEHPPLVIEEMQMP